MIEKIAETAASITKLIDEIIEDNTDESFVNEVEFDFTDEHDCYKTSEFKDILDNHFKDKNITYTFEEIRYHVAFFNIKLHDWIK